MSRNPLLSHFVIGGVLIFLIRWLAPSLPGALLASAVAIIAVVSLAHGHWQRGSQDLRIAGDEAYYLGLLFTLVSLIIALLQLFAGDSGDAIDLRERTQALIGNFGVALISTVAGILVRVLLQSAADRGPGSTGENREGDDLAAPSQNAPGRDPGSAGRKPWLRDSTDTPSAGGDAGQDPDQGEPRGKSPGTRGPGTPGPSPDQRPGRQGTREGRTLSGPFPDHGIDDEVYALKQEIRLATDALSHFRRMTFRYAEDAKTHAETLSREFNEQITEKIRADLTGAANAWRELIDRMRQDHQTFSERSNQLLGELGGQLGDAAQARLREVAATWEAVGAELGKQGEGFAHGLQSAATAAAERASAAWHPVIATLQETAASTKDRLQADVAEMAAMLSSLESARSSLNALVTALQGATTRLESLAVHTAGASTGLDERASQVVKAHETLIREMGGLRTSVLADVREQLNAGQRDLADEGNRWQGAVQQLAQRGGEQLAAAERVNAELAQHAERWSKVADETNQSLVAVVDELTKIVRKG